MKKLISFLIISTFISLKILAQQSNIDLAYSSNDTASFESLINENTIKNSVSQNKNVSSLMTEFYKNFEMLMIDKKASLNTDYNQSYFLNKLQFLQPVIATYQTKKIDFDKIRDTKRKLLDSDESYGFFKFDTLFNIKNSTYHINHNPNFRLQPIVIKDNLKFVINEFLNVAGFLSIDNKKEHVKRASFLKTKINLTVNNLKSTKDYKNYTFNYIFDIRKIVFDEFEKNAVIQIILDQNNQSEEYYYTKDNNEWKLISIRELLTFD